MLESKCNKLVERGVHFDRVVWRDGGEGEHSTIGGCARRQAVEFENKSLHSRRTARCRIDWVGEWQRPSGLGPSTKRSIGVPSLDGRTG
jgi:hypothetical protein